MDSTYLNGLKALEEQENEILKKYLIAKAKLISVEKELNEIRDKIIAFKESHGIYQNVR